MINSPSRPHLVVVTDAHSSHLYGPFQSTFAAHSWALRHKNDFAGRTVHVTPSQPIKPDSTWLVTMTSSTEEVQFQVTCETEDEALYEAQQLLEEEGEDAADYEAIAAQIA